jgi:hypothetical protein
MTERTPQNPEIMEELSSPSHPGNPENLPSQGSLEDVARKLEAEVNHLRQELEMAQQMIATAGREREQVIVELREREEATRYEVLIFGVGQWHTAWRGASRLQSKAEAQQISAERIGAGLGDQAFVKVVGLEEVWDNTDLVSESRERRRNQLSPPSPTSPSARAPLSASDLTNT